MFNATWMTKYKGDVGTLQLKRKVTSLGIYEDVNGNEWDVAAIMGSKGGLTVCARKVSDAPSYYGTASYDTSEGLHQWIPYYVEVV